MASPESKRAVIFGLGEKMRRIERTGFYNNYVFRRLVLRLVQLGCVVGIGWSISQMILSSVRTLGAIVYHLIPVAAYLSVIYLAKRLENVPLRSLLSMRKSGISIKVMTIVVLLAFSLALAMITETVRIRSAVDLLMLFAIAIGTLYAAMLMASGRGMEAFYMLILSSPFLIYETSPAGCLQPDLFQGLDFPVRFEATGVPFLLVIFVGWTRLSLVWNREKTRLIRPEIWLLLAAGLISTVSTAHPGISWAHYAFRIVVPMMGLAIFTYYIRSWNDVKRLFLVIIITCCLMLLLGIYYSFYRAVGAGSLIEQYMEHRSGSDTVLGGVNYTFSVPAMASIALAPMIALWYTASRKREKALWLTFCLLSLAFVFLSFQRSYWIGLIIILLPWVVTNRRFRLTAVLTLIALALAWTMMPTFFSFDNPLFRRFKTLSTLEMIQEESRYMIWRGALHMFLDNPWLGVGMGIFDSGKIQGRYGVSYWGANVMSTHSGLLQAATDMGIPGIIAWGAFLWRLVHSGITLTRYYRVDLEMRPWILVLAGIIAGKILDLFIGSLPMMTLDKPGSIIGWMQFAVIVSMAEKVGKSVTIFPSPTKQQMN